MAEVRVNVVVDRLVESGLISIDTKGRIKLQVAKTSTTNDIPSSAVRLLHKDCMKIAVEKIDVIPVEDRYFSTTTMSISREKLPEAKAIIQEFKQKISSLLESGKKDEVYNLALQLYPLTELKNEGDKK